MPTPVVACEGHFEDDVSLNAAPNLDDLTTLVDIPLGHWFLFLSCTEDATGAPTFFSWTTVEHANFTQHNGSGGIGGILQAFGPGYNNHDANTSRSEFATLDAQIDVGETLAVRTNQTSGATLKKRVYLGLEWDGFLDSPYPNTPANFSDIEAFDGFEESNPPGAAGTAVSMALPADDRYWTRVGADPQGRPGMLLAYLGWEASGSPVFTPDAGWTLAALYDPADTYAIAVYYKTFGPDDTDYTFSGSFDAATAFQTHIAAYKVLPVEEPADNPAQGICVALENDTHELDQVWTRIDDPDA